MDMSGCEEVAALSEAVQPSFYAALQGKKSRPSAVKRHESVSETLEQDDCCAAGPSRQECSRLGRGYRRGTSELNSAKEVLNEL